MEMIASQFMLGSAQITIHDDNCVSREEADEILKDIAKLVQPGLARKEMKKRKEEAESRELHNI